MGVSLFSSANLTFLERTSPRIQATLLDDDDLPVPGSSVTTLTMTLYDVVEDSIINARDGQNILNANGCTLDEDGLFTWLVEHLDTVIVGATELNALEEHVALIEGTHTAGSRHFKQEIRHFVKNLGKVP